MILQAPEPMLLDVIRTIGAPLAQVLIIIWFLKKYVMPNGDTKETLKEIAETTATTLITAQKANEQHQDLERTRHFDQLRRDLTMTIENQAKLSRDDVRSAVSALFLRQDLERLRRQGIDE